MIYFKNVTGDWFNEEVCKKGNFVKGFRTKVDKTEKGLKDATALNAIELICNNGIRITSNQGPWGEWGSEDTCKNGSVNGFRFKVEESQGTLGDDTGANGIELKCSNGQTLKSVEGRWGKWSEFIYCPNGTYFCGISTQVENRRGVADDSALYNVLFLCCYKIFP